MSDKMFFLNEHAHNGRVRTYLLLRSVRSIVDELARDKSSSIASTITRVIDRDGEKRDSLSVNCKARRETRRKAVGDDG